MIEIKKASFENIENIIEIINDAKSFLKSQGLDQWQQGYPNESSIRNDIINNNSYVLLDMLMSLKRSAPINFELIPVHIDSNFPNAPEYLLEDHLKKVSLND